MRFTFNSYKDSTLHLKDRHSTSKNSKDLDLDLRELAGNLTWQEPADMSQVISYVRRPRKGCNMLQ